MKKLVLLLIVSFLFFCVKAQKSKLQYDGQLSSIFSYNPQNELNLFLGARYIPELYYNIPLDTNKIKSLDFQASANIFGNVLFHPFDTAKLNGNILPYRIWARFAHKNYEVRIGLQKIDFGSASLLRPLQWFNEIDPRDPLNLTNGVYGGLFRYYFKNNANIWLWTLFWNEKTRGLDQVTSFKKHPEIGGRIQYPSKRGEIAVSYHHRTANAENLFLNPAFEKIGENRIGIDGKWDVVIGLWFEAVYVRKAKNIGALTNQTQFNLGADYTIGVGSGLNIMAEHLLASYDTDAFHFHRNINTTALSISYPIGFNDNISTFMTYSWEAKAYSFFLNYEHRFKKVTGYLMAYYNPKVQQVAGIQTNDLTDTFTGFGSRLMVVFNH